MPAVLPSSCLKTVPASQSQKESPGQGLHFPAHLCLACTWKATIKMIKTEDVQEVFHLLQIITCATETLLLQQTPVKSPPPICPTGTGGEISPALGMPMGCQDGGEMEVLDLPRKVSQLFCPTVLNEHSFKNSLNCLLPFHEVLKTKNPHNEWINK